MSRVGRSSSSTASTAATALSFRNLPEIQLIKAGELNAYDVLCNDWIVFEQSLLPTATAPVEEEQDIIAEHGEDPAEGARDESTDPEHGEAGSEGAELSSAGEAAGSAGGTSTEDETA